MSGDYPNGLSRSGRDRLDQIERQQDRLVELMGALGNKIDVYAERQAQLRSRQDAHDAYHLRWEQDHGSHVKDHETRHTAHEERHRISETRWKVAGIVAGLLAAAFAVIARGGVPDVTIP